MTRDKSEIKSRDGLLANPSRDKTHAEFLDRWADYIKSVPRDKWKAEQTAFINAVFEKAEQFYKRLEQTEKGREILKGLREERVNRKK